MDVLSKVLEKIKLSSAVYFKSDFPAPWGMEVPKGPFSQFHLVAHGKCLLHFQEEFIELFEGDIVVFPLGSHHWLADAKTSKRASGQEVLTAIQQGESLFQGTQLHTTLVCGHFEFDRSFDHPVISELPNLIHITKTEKKDYQWLAQIVELIKHESAAGQVGSHVIVNKLGEILFMHVLRAHMLQQKRQQGFLAALLDPRMAKALTAIHLNPAFEWKLQGLAQIAGMSRTSFCNRFKSLIGDTPLNYVTQWRMLCARELLLQSAKPVGEIALEVGYRSEAAFNRVFKKRMVLTPLKFRMERR
ncbi:AraC family transcriptional regulator [Spongiimicrobium sp. 3-5]|uniref:AraC family transcriptional regulator n=1 Tax=Spongiimicrobium sp. 3-5 TaxID=3332596 RepID=UPI00397F85EB